MNCAQRTYDVIVAIKGDGWIELGAMQGVCDENGELSLGMRRRQWDK